MAGRAKRGLNLGPPGEISNEVVSTVSCHNFKSQIFKLSVSNPKSKYVAYLSVLSQISNCQGLGRKNKHELLKTDRILFVCLICMFAVVSMFDGLLMLLLVSMCIVAIIV